MCSNTIVKLLVVAIVCWAGLPAAGSQSQGGAHLANQEGFLDQSGSEAAPPARGVLLASLKAHDPIPPNGACGVIVPSLSWTPGDTAFFHNFYWGTSPALGNANFMGRLPKATIQYYVTIGGPGTYYWRVDEVEQDGTTVHTGDVWCFTTSSSPECDLLPPYGIMNACCDPVLTWPPVAMAVAYEVYFGDGAGEVAGRTPAVDKGTIPQRTLSLGTLQNGTTYYWIVDPVMGDGTHGQGSMSHYRVPACPNGGVLREWWLNIPGTSVSDLTSNPRYPADPNGRECLDCFEGPTDWADNYGSRLTAWLLPPVSGEYTFWIASDDNSELWLSTDDSPANVKLIASVGDWTGPLEWDWYARQKSVVLQLEAGKKYYMQALMKEGGGGDSIAVAWQRPGMTAREVICAPYVENPTCTPFIAHWPSPRDGERYVETTPVLRWHAGRDALGHDLYLSDDYEAVINGCPCGCPAYKGRLSRADFNDLGPLVPGRTYYWRVDELNPFNPAGPWRGCVWSFTTSDCIVVIDDFESYTDSNALSRTWVATPPVEIERTIVHSGQQSMRMNCDNSGPPYYYEAARTFDTPQNWTLNGMSTLGLAVRGYPQVPSVGVTVTDGKLTLTGDGSDIWNNSDQFIFAYRSLNGDASIVARVTSNGAGSNTWAKGGVMIRDSLDGGSAHAMMVITGGGGNGASFQYRETADGTSGNSDSIPAVTPPSWVKLERMGDTFSGYLSADGTTWTLVGTHDVVMTPPDYIGICVTSHQTGEERTFEFDGIRTTGNVTGQWQGVVISNPWYNSPQNLYVVVEDSTGHLAVASNPTAVNAATWTEVKIPLSSFVGANVTKVRKMVIGVGDRTNPSPDGVSRIYIDDICLE